MRTLEILKCLNEELPIRNMQLANGCIQHIFVIANNYNEILDELKQMNISTLSKDNVFLKLESYSDNIKMLKANDTKEDTMILDILCDESGFKQVSLFDLTIKEDTFRESINTILEDFFGNDETLIGLLNMNDNRFTFLSFAKLTNPFFKVSSNHKNPRYFEFLKFFIKYLIKHDIDNIDDVDCFLHHVVYRFNK